jgi:hypothetical protein
MLFLFDPLGDQGVYLSIARPYNQTTVEGHRCRFNDSSE